jgi:hypothetical protein
MFDQFRAPDVDALEPRRLLAADLSLSLSDLQNPFSTRSGDSLKVTATIVNAGNERFSGRGRVLFFLSADDTLDATDAVFATRDIPRLSGPGSRATVRLDLPEPKLLHPPAGQLPVAAGLNRVLARLDFDNPAHDSNPANNVALAAGTVNIDYRFGNFNNARLPISVRLPDGSTITLKIEGQGSGAVSTDPSGRTIISVNGTDFRTSLVISNSNTRGLSTVNAIAISSPIKTIRADKIVVDGFMQISSTVSEVKLGGLRNGSLTIGGFATAASLELGDVRNAVVSSPNTPLSRVTVKSWSDTDAAQDLLTAPSIGQLSSSGNFQPAVTVTRFDSNFISIQKITVTGELAGAWRLAGGAGIFKLGSTKADLRMGVLGPIEHFFVTGHLRGLVAMQTVKRLDVGGSLIGATILAGTVLGDDLLLGGSGSDADRFFAGTIEFINIRGSLNSSTVAAGLSSVNDIIPDADDRFVSSGFSGLRFIDVRGSLNNSFFFSPNIPATARINLRTVNTEDEPAFVSILPRP